MVMFSMLTNNSTWLLLSMVSEVDDEIEPLRLIDP